MFQHDARGGLLRADLGKRDGVGVANVDAERPREGRYLPETFLRAVVDKRNTPTPIAFGTASGPTTRLGSAAPHSRCGKTSTRKASINRLI